MNFCVIWKGLCAKTLRAYTFELFLVATTMHISKLKLTLREPLAEHGWAYLHGVMSSFDGLTHFAQCSTVLIYMSRLLILQATILLWIVTLANVSPLIALVMAPASVFGAITFAPYGTLHWLSRRSIGPCRLRIVRSTSTGMSESQSFKEGPDELVDRLGFSMVITSALATTHFLIGVAVLSCLLADTGVRHNLSWAIGWGLVASVPAYFYAFARAFRTRWKGHEVAFVS